MNTILFVVILFAVFALGYWLQYYGRTCPACLRRKQKIVDALKGAGIKEAPEKIPEGGPGGALPMPPPPDTPVMFTPDEPLIAKPQLL